MDALDFLESHKYTEAIAECRRRLAINPHDMGAAATLASALKAVKDYREALLLFERVGFHEQENKLTPGHPGRWLEISCMHWFLGDREKAIDVMHGLVEGILDGSISYGDAAGGVTQGLLLYYMAVTQNLDAETSFALKYLKKRARRSAIRNWPGPVARYYLGDIKFDDVLESATGQRHLSAAFEVARTKLLSRRRLCGVLFYDGVRRRAQGAEELCLARMRECYELENPLIEPEWYFARYEVEQVLAAGVAGYTYVRAKTHNLDIVAGQGQTSTPRKPTKP
jgi:tetratricopeptide (TPR) repeat protein